MSQPVTIRLNVVLLLLLIILSCFNIYKTSTMESQMLIWLDDAEKERAELIEKKGVPLIIPGFDSKPSAEFSFSPK